MLLPRFWASECVAEERLEITFPRSLDDVGRFPRVAVLPWEMALPRLWPLFVPLCLLPLLEGAEEIARPRSCGVGLLCWEDWLVLA